jgi:integrase
MTASNGKRVEIGLGSASALGLAAARRIATDMREAVALGRDPRVITAKPVAAKAVPKFGAFAEDYIASVENGWRNPIHRKQWRSSLRDHAAALHDKPVDAITTDDVVAVLQPIWLEKSETAKRVRSRIEKILDAAKARELRPGDAPNPALFRGHLELLLPKQSKLTRGHHAALPWRDAPAFVTSLRQRDAVAARCLEFTILTASRSGEALGAKWVEINPRTLVWWVPAERMKAARKHEVPLSRAVENLLLSIKPDKIERNTPIFAVNGAHRSNMAMTMLMRRMGFGRYTVHGFRSTFRDWAGETTSFPREIIEHALAHVISNKSEAAYRRETAVERRRELMEAWANFLG